MVNDDGSVLREKGSSCCEDQFFLLLLVSLAGHPWLSFKNGEQMGPEERERERGRNGRARQTGWYNGPVSCSVSFLLLLLLLGLLLQDMVRERKGDKRERE